MVLARWAYFFTKDLSQIKACPPSTLGQDHCDGANLA